MNTMKRPGDTLNKPKKSRRNATKKRAVGEHADEAGGRFY